MYTTGEIAAQLAWRRPASTRWTSSCFWKGFPTYASTQTIFTILKANWYYLEQNKFVEWDVTANFDVVVPGQHETRHRRAVGRHRPSCLVQQRSARVANVKAMGGVLARDVMEGVVATTQMVKENIKPLPLDQQEMRTRQDRRQPAGLDAAA